MDGVSSAIAPAEITAIPCEVDLADLGAIVSGEVHGYAAHNHQVKVRLDKWRTYDERSLLGRPRSPSTDRQRPLPTAVAGDTRRSPISICDTGTAMPKPGELAASGQQ